MCWSCFLEYTDTPTVNEKVLFVADLLEAHPEAEYSSLLHIMVGDMNLDDFWFDFDEPRGENLRESYLNAEGWERDIFDALAGLSEPERATAVAMDWGYLDREGRYIERG